MTKQQQADFAVFLADPAPQPGETLLCGVDPGSTGAIAWTRPAPNTAALTDIPQTYVSVGKKSLVLPDAVSLRRALEPGDNRYRGYAFIELVPAYIPGPGVKNPPGAGLAGYKKGAALAGLWTLFALLGFALEKARPLEWKKELGLDSIKQKSIARAKQLYPDFAADIGSNDNRAEALLLLHYALLHVWPGLK